jgi:hypothetical protein
VDSNIAESKIKKEFWRLRCRDIGIRFLGDAKVHLTDVVGNEWEGYINNLLWQLDRRPDGHGRNLLETLA